VSTAAEPFGGQLIAHRDITGQLSTLPDAIGQRRPWLKRYAKAVPRHRTVSGVLSEAIDEPTRWSPLFGHLLEGRSLIAPHVAIVVLVQYLATTDCEKVELSSQHRAPFRRPWTGPVGESSAAQRHRVRPAHRRERPHACGGAARPHFQLEDPRKQEIAVVRHVECAEHAQPRPATGRMATGYRSVDDARGVIDSRCP
jgi:hypothetical protein